MTIYCESLGFQPINVISNIAAFIAAYFAYRVLTKNNVRSFNLRIFPLLVVLIGIGSILWHALPNALTDLADVLPLSILILSTFYFLLSKLNVRRFSRIVILSIFILVQTPFIFGLVYSLNGFLPYIITFAVAMFLFYKLSKSYHNVIRYMAPIVVVFGIALFFRTIDLTVCPAIGIGTHFLWQILSAVTFYLFVRLLIKIEQGTKIKYGEVA